MGARLGGMVVGVGDSVSTGNVIRIEDFNDPDNAYSMIDMWKSDGSDVYQNAMVWAQQTTIRLTAPLANVSGVVYMGYFPLGSVVQSNGDT